MTQHPHTSAYADVVATLNRLISSGQWHQACEHVTTHPTAVREEGMTMITGVFLHIAELHRSDADFDDVLSLMRCVCRSANVKEALLAVLETLHVHRESDACFSAALAALQLLLLSRDACTLSQLEWSFNAVHQRFRSALGQPDNGRDLSGEQQREAPLVNLERIRGLLADIVSFAAPFVDRLVPHAEEDVVIKSWLNDSAKHSPQNVSSSSLERARFCLLSFLLAFFDTPLFNLSLNRDSVLYNVVQSLITHITRLMSNFMLLTTVFDAVSVSACSSDVVSAPERLSRLASPRAVSAYLHVLLAVGVPQPQCVPAVFSAEYVLLRSLPAVVLMLQHEETVVDKALSLCETLFQRVPLGHLMTVHAETLLSVFHALARCAELCQCEALRSRSARALLQLELRFTARARYSVLAHLLNSGNPCSVSVRAYVIDRVRANVVTAFGEAVCDEKTALVHGDSQENDVRIWFLSPNLQALLRACCRMKLHSSADLLDNHTCVMAALNLLRYILIRDCHRPVSASSKSDVTGIWRMQHELESCFLTPLATAIDTARSQMTSCISGQADVDVVGPVSCSIADIQECVGQQQETARLMRTTIELQSSVLQWVRQSYTQCR